MASFVGPLLREPRTEYRLRNRRTGTFIAERVVGAFDSASRNRGLLKRDSMPEGEALIIAPCNAIHTWFMRFDIDVAFVSKTGAVLKIRHRVRPWRLAASLRAFAVIELAGGVLEATGSQSEDVLELVAR
jgi:uncharacterized membrane protein (UPF0127 family)